jgi:hypothetical protein
MRDSTDKKERPVVIFIHIAKAAGTTLHSIIEREYSRSRTWNADTYNLKDSIEEIKNMPTQEVDRIDLLKGHVSFGLHEYFHRNCTYITMLRNPTDRIVSHYRYASGKQDHYLNKIIVSQKMSLMDYVSSGISEEMDNVMVRMLSNHLFDVPYGGCTEEMLEVAKYNLEKHFSVVGLAERFDESVLLMKDKLKWKKIPLYYRKNVTRFRGPVDPLTEDVRKYIDRSNSLDWSLYQFGKEIFESEIFLKGKRMENELIRFRSMNAVYSKLAGLGGKIKRSLKSMSVR